MTTRSTPHGAIGPIGTAAQEDANRGAPGRTQPGQPASHPPPGPHGEPALPTGKPLPDLPNPTEVGEDG